MAEVDPSFIQAIEHRPKLTVTEAQGIPLIDLSISNTQLLVSQIGDACKNWGFFQVINHGVPLKSREKLLLASRSFYALPKEEKLKVRRDEVNPFGYYDTEHTKNVRDWKEVLIIRWRIRLFCLLLLILMTKSSSCWLISCLRILYIWGTGSLVLIHVPSQNNSLVLTELVVLTKLLNGCYCLIGFNQGGIWRVCSRSEEAVLHIDGTHSLELRLASR